MQPLTVASNGIEIAYETFGAPGGRPLLLVTGLGAQMLVWHPELCAALAAEDFFVVRYDNRDVGLSTHLHDAPPPNLGAAIGGDFSSASYRVEDMAERRGRAARRARAGQGACGRRLARRNDRADDGHHAPRPGPKPHLHHVHPRHRNRIS